MANDWPSDTSYLLAPSPPPFHGMGKLEILTPGGCVGLYMPNIKVTHDDGEYMAEIEAEGRTWTGEGGSYVAAIIALLADRAGYRAVVKIKEDA